MKYGGRGGYKAIKRFRRDARIAAGENPYGKPVFGERSSSGGSGSGSMVIEICIFVLVLVALFKCAAG